EAAGANADAQLKALYYAEDLAKHGRKIEREARLAIEETGSNMLYLVVGFLDYPENKDSDKTFRAPLTGVPVRLEKQDRGQYPSYSLLYTGEEITDNESLREKVKRDFGIILPNYDQAQSLSDYLREVEGAIAHLPRWKVRH